MADEQLKIGVSVDVGPLAQLAAVSETTAKSTETLTRSMQRLGQEALTGKMRAADWVAEQYRAEAAAMALGLQTKQAATSVDSLTRAMASSGTRIAAAELGLGQLGMAFGRVAGASNLLAPAMAAAFPVFAGLALVNVVDTLYGKLRALEMAAYAEAAAWQKIDHESAVSFENIDRAIDAANVKIVDLTQGKLEAFKLERTQIGNGAVAMAGDPPNRSLLHRRLSPKFARNRFDLRSNIVRSFLRRPNVNLVDYTFRGSDSSHVSISSVAQRSAARTPGQPYHRLGNAQPSAHQ